MKTNSRCSFSSVVQNQSCVPPLSGTALTLNAQGSWFNLKHITGKKEGGNGNGEGEQGKEGGKAEEKGKKEEKGK